jgi:AraC-like DNA-binding protein
MNMEKLHSYLYFEDVQNVLTTHKEKYGTRIDLLSAAMKLKKEGKVFHYANHDLHFIDWDGEDFEQLRKIYMRYPIDVTDIYENPQVYLSKVPENLSFFKRDIWPILLMNDEKENYNSNENFEVVYVLKGKARVCVNGQYLDDLTVGDFVIIAPDTMHSSFALEDAIVFDISIKASCLETAFFNLMHTDSVLSLFFRNCLYGNQQNYLLFHVPPKQHITYLIKGIFTESYSTKSFANEVCNSLFGILMAEVLRTYRDTYIHYSAKKNTNVQMPLILTYIQSNYRTISLKALSEFFGYNTDYLGKLIHQSTGMYFNDIVNQYKINEASELLLTTSLPLEAIAEQSGFNSVDHFSRTFKKSRNITPGKFRARGRNR